MSGLDTYEEQADADLLDAQQAAISRSGWAQPFRPWQPHNAAMWLGAFLIATGVISLFRFVGTEPRAYLASAAGGALVWALYAIPWVLFLRRRERYGRRPVRLVVWGFAWGALAATLALAKHANDAALGLWGKLVSTDFAAKWGPALTAPIVEESAKAAGFVLLMALAPRLIRSAYDGFITGAVSHAVFTALVCMGIVWLAGRPDEPRRPRIHRDRGSRPRRVRSSGRER